MWLCLCLDTRFENAFENSLWRKSIQMQTMRLCICSSKQLEETFKNTLRGEIVKCNLCYFASVLKDALRSHLKWHDKTHPIIKIKFLPWNFTKKKRTKSSTCDLDWSCWRRFPKRQKNNCKSNIKMKRLWKANYYHTCPSCKMK